MTRHWTAIVFVCALAAASATPSSAIAADEPVAIQSFLRENFAGSNAAIVIGLVDESGSQIFTAGKLDNGTENPVDAESVFFIGSVSKTFTALLLQEMADRGEVKLDDPVAKFLPESVKVPSVGGREITLLDLATHTAGFPINPDNMTGREGREQYETYTVEKMYAYLAGYQLTREPGAEFSYSNLGMALLGHALARKAGTDYESLLIERICRPLGMESTRISLTPEMKARRATGHDDQGQASLPFKLQAYSPAGDIHSTAKDLIKYASAQAGLTTSKLTPSIMKTHLIRHRDSRGLAEDPGFGAFGQTAMDWVDRGALQPPGMELLGHAGGAGSYHAFVGFDQKQKRGVVVLTTGNELGTEAMGWTLLQRLPLNRQSAKDFAREMIGIGTALELTKESQALRISKVFPKSPAAEAGIQGGAIIQSIDGTSAAGKSLADCLKLIRGSAGTKVRLELLDTEGKTQVVEVTRAKFVLSN
jgi:D-alanyl-D-alanine-carboxypeptidase/D-alanyl-D-alanine-endopeptidase